MLIFMSIQKVIMMQLQHLKSLLQLKRAEQLLQLRASASRTERSSSMFLALTTHALS